MSKPQLCDSDRAGLNMASWTAATSPFQRAAPHLRFAFGPARALGLWIALLAVPCNSWFARNSNAQEGAKMKVKLEAAGPTLTLEEIHGFEAEIGGRLAKQYVEFLLRQNGGLNDPRLGLAWKDGIETIALFRPLLPTSDRGLRRGLKDLRELGMDGFLPIASSFGGLEVCISFRENIGAIFITDYVYKIVFRGDRVPIAVTMAPLAPSFTDFLKMLVEIPDPYCRIEELGEKGTPADLDQYLAEGKPLDALGKNGLTIACEAIKYDNLPMLKACIARGASLSRTVQIAVRNKRLGVIKMLVDAGADINERDKYGDTPLQYVGGTALPDEEGAENRELLELLLELGARK